MFTVTAGKYDDYERNVKFIADADTLDKAIVLYLSVSDYPWAEIEYQGIDNTTWILTAIPKPEHLR